MRFSPVTEEERRPRPRAVVVSHHAERTGAAIVLRDLTRAGAFDGFDIEFLFLVGGPLVPEFAALGPVRFFGLAPNGVPQRGLRRVPSPIGPMATRIAVALGRRRARRRIRGSDVLYLNTVLSGAVLRGLRQCPPHVVAHIHELAGWLDHDPPATAAALSADRIIAVSEPVRRELTARGVPEDKLVLLHGSVQTDRWPQTDRAARLRARHELELDTDAFVVVSAGTADERKGVDLFVDAAAVAASTDDSTRFLWCGRFTDAQIERRMSEAESVRSGAARFVGELPSPLVAYQAADVFLLSSREDPFPLVCLEAAATGLPLVVYAGSGGMPDFVEDDAGIVVSQATSEAFAAALTHLRAEPGLRAQLGRRAAEKVRERHDVETAAKSLRSCLEGVLRR